MHLGIYSLSHMLIFNIALQIQLNGPSLLPYCIKRDTNRATLESLCLGVWSLVHLASTLYSLASGAPLPNVVVFEEFHVTLNETKFEIYSFSSVTFFFIGL